MIPDLGELLGNLTSVTSLCSFIAYVSLQHIFCLCDVAQIVINIEPSPVSSPHTLISEGRSSACYYLQG